MLQNTRPSPEASEPQKPVPVTMDTPEVPVRTQPQNPAVSPVASELPNNAAPQSDSMASPIDVVELALAPLALKFRTMPESMHAHEEAIQNARISLGKYNLESEQLDEAAPLLARALEMHREQKGTYEIDEQSRQEIERQVLDWCRCRH